MEASFLVFLMLLKLPPKTKKVLTGLQIVLTKTQDTQNRIKYTVGTTKVVPSGWPPLLLIVQYGEF